MVTWFGRYFLLRIVFLMMYSRLTIQSDIDTNIGVDGNLDVEDNIIQNGAINEVDNNIHKDDNINEVDNNVHEDDHINEVDNDGPPNEFTPPEKQSEKKRSKEILTVDNEENTIKKKSKKAKNIKLLIRSEPGFDFTKDEMRKFKIWDKGIIPYYIDDYSFDYSMREKIRKVLHDFNRLTGVHFTELPSPPDDEKMRWVFFINRRGILSCEDYITNSFTIKGVQRVVLGYDCLGADVNGAALAPTMLALVGVPPQHNSPDRDQYIRINIDNVIPEKRNLFKILKNSEWLFHDIDYDYLSASHYDFHKYTTNGSATIVPQGKLKYISDVGQGDGISLKDIWKTKMLYNYISLNRHNAKLSDCSRIFKLGNAFQMFKPTESSVIPRDKPYKYSGIDSNHKTGLDKKPGKNDIDMNENKGEKGGIVDAVALTDKDSPIRKPLKSKKGQNYKQLQSSSKLSKLKDTDYDTDGK